MQRIIGFVTCIGLGLFCMSLSTLYIPVLILKARKFALLFSLGSLFFILRYINELHLFGLDLKNNLRLGLNTIIVSLFTCSFCFLSGFLLFFKQAFSKSRLSLSGSYAGSLIATIYFAMWSQSTALTVLFAVVQVITLLLMILAEVPGGTTGLRFFGQLFKRSVTSSLPV